MFWWATQSGAELDVLLTWRSKRYGIEVKYADAPTVTRSMRVAMDDLKLGRLWVVYPGEESYPLDQRIEVTSLAGVMQKLRRLGMGR